MKLLMLSFFIASLFVSTPSLHAATRKEIVRQEIVSIPGWCSQKKAEAMMDLIYETRPQVCVELGVFAGSSLFPTAMALKDANCGVVYGIDAWDTAIAVQYYPSGTTHRTWWEQLNMNSYKRCCERLIRRFDLRNHCILLKESFAEACDRIETIDILHIDGSHTSEGDFIDALPYCEKVRLGGHIWFDGWSTSLPLYEHLKKNFLIRKVVNSGQCILLQKISEE